MSGHARAPVCLACLLTFAWASLAWGQVAYDIVFVKAPRHSETVHSRMPEVLHPILTEPGTDLVLLHPDGTEEVLVDCDVCAIMDPKVSFDAQWIYYSRFHDMTQLQKDFASGQMPKLGADLYKIHVVTREVVQLTFGEFTPNTGVATWSRDPLTAVPAGTTFLGYRPINTGPCPLPGNKLMFTSSRNGYLPNKGFTFPNLQLFVLDETTGIVEQIGYLNLGSALHPVVLMDGRVMFSSYESQGLRDERLWGIWAIYPDGRHWEPLMSAFNKESSLHWQAQLSDGRITVVDYYNQNNNGFGTLVAFAGKLPGQPMAPPVPSFGSPDPKLNPRVAQGYSNNGTTQDSKQYPFSPPALVGLTPFADASDSPSDRIDGVWMGKVTQPSGAPGNDLLLVYTPGAANDKGAQPPPTYDAGLYLLRGGIPTTRPEQLVLIKNDPAYNEQQPQAVVSYRAIYGIDAPATLPWLPNDGSQHPALPTGTPYGLVGTSTFAKADVRSPIVPDSNYRWAGSALPDYSFSQVHAVRIVQMEPHSHRAKGPNATPHQNHAFINPGKERLRILGEIPLRKFDANGQPVLDVDGNPDTSFLALIPADAPFTFQTLDELGHAIAFSQTWHQVRPGEVRTDCGGCHAHSQFGTGFARTAAGQPGFQPVDLTQQPPVDVEYLRDIKPILQRVAPALAALTPEQLIAQYTLPFRSKLSTLWAHTSTATPEELRQMRAWIDLGAPVDKHAQFGWFLDELRPTLSLHLQRQSVSCPAGCQPVATTTQVIVGAYDAYLVAESLQVWVDATEVTAQLRALEGNRWALPLEARASVVVKALVKDQQGNWTEQRLAIMGGS